MDADTLTAIEEIKQLKARYFRLMDTKQWEDWADLFTEDLDAWFEETGRSTHGRDEFVSGVRAVLGDDVTVHHGHMPEIEIIGPEAARGVWAMFDHVKLTSLKRPVEFKGNGHYHEEYRKGADGRWRISSLRLHRIRVDHV